MHPESTLKTTEIAPDNARGDALVSANINTLTCLHGGLQSLTDLAYTNSDGKTSSIGMHTRHIIEFYQEFFKSIRNQDNKTTCPELCYDNRQRNMVFETSKDTGLEEIENLKQDFKSLCTQDCDISLSMTIHPDQPLFKMRTNLHRELFHLLDHAVHHMAIIKMEAQKCGIEFDEGFGLANATQAHQNKS